MENTIYLTRRIVKQGGSLGLNIPKQILAARGLKRGDDVKIWLIGEVIAVQKLDTSGFTPGVIAVRPGPVEAS